MMFSSTVNLAPLYGVMNELIVAVLSALAGWAVLELRGFLAAHSRLVSAQASTVIAGDVDDALHKGIDYATAAGQKIEDEHGTVTVDNPFVAMAARYAIGAVPDKLKALGITDDKVAHMVLARLPAPPVAA